MSKLFILTLNWNGEDKLRKLAPTLLNSVEGLDFEWFVKDNGSKDNSISYLKSIDHSKINVIPYKNNNQNFSAGTNYLFNLAQPKDNDLVLLLNNDIVFNDLTSLKTMINLIKNDSSVGVVGAKLLYSGSDLLQHAGLVFNKIKNYPIHHRDRQKSDIYSQKNRCFQAVTGAVLLTTAELYRNVCNNSSGMFGMDENYHWAFDDVDLCLSIKLNLNKKIVYCGETNIFHDSSASLKKNPANMLFINHNLSYLRNKWGKKYLFDDELYIKDTNYNLYK